ncbi:MAG TPA: hypothetical protein VNO21_00790, partial [Polyangiaceae bacterium]|nr:hypothetical protein [Polyangiaceae bacterium]
MEPSPEHAHHQGPHRASHDGAAHGGEHHAHSVADFRRRFWVSLALTVPVLALAPMTSRMGLRLGFPGSS